MRTCCFALLSVTLLISTSFAAEPGFQPDGEDGYFAFDTGAVRGKIRLTGRMQGITELVHVESGVEVAHGGKLPGLFSYYRALATNLRYGAAVRDWLTVPEILPDGALKVTFPPAGEHPLEIVVVHRWLRPDTLDVETTVKPQEDMPRFELFTSNYFNEGFAAAVYLKPARHGGGEPSLVPTDWSPLVDGTYLMFPRDGQAARGGVFRHMVLHREGGGRHRRLPGAPDPGPHGLCAECRAVAPGNLEHEVPL
jgi:hypothetical protein